MKRTSQFMIILMLLAMTVTMTTFQVYAIESRIVYGTYQYGLYVLIYAPYQCYPGTTVSIPVRVEAIESVIDVEIAINIYGSKQSGYSSWSIWRTISHSSLSAGVLRWDNQSVTIPADASPGLAYSQTTVTWKSWVTTWLGGYWTDRSNEATYQILYTMNKDYENLQSEYSELQSDHNYLQSNYNNLQSSYNNLKSDYDDLQSEKTSLKTQVSTLQTNVTRLQSDKSNLQAQVNDAQSELAATRAQNSTATNLALLAIVVAGVFLVTTIYFAARKPKVKTA